MGVDWDLHLLSPLHGVFGDEHEYRPKVGAPFTINGIFDRTKEIQIDLGSVGNDVVVPIFPGVSGVVGASGFIVEFPQLK